MCERKRAQLFLSAPGAKCPGSGTADNKHIRARLIPEPFVGGIVAVSRRVVLVLRRTCTHLTCVRVPFELPRTSDE